MFKLQREEKTKLSKPREWDQKWIIKAGKWVTSDPWNQEIWLLLYICWSNFYSFHIEETHFHCSHRSWTINAWLLQMLCCQGCTINQARVWHCKGRAVISGNVWHVSNVRSTHQTAQQIMTGSALAVRHRACSKARSIRSNKNKFEMLGQRSEILSCYRSLDYFFKWLPVPVSRKQTQIHTC